MLTTPDILRIAMEQSAYDCNCLPTDFQKTEPVLTLSQKHPLARKYLNFPLACDLVSYGSNIVAQGIPETLPILQEYLATYPVSHAFETPNLHVLDDKMAHLGLRTCFMAEYFLPQIDVIPTLPCPYECRVLHQSDFAELYTPTWCNALCADRRELDVLGVGAYDGGRLIGLAACSADCDTMYQIGVDVLPDYRRCGVASALTARLAKEILQMDKVPFYCAAWCNVPSVRNAIRCGFRPAWVELTVKPTDFVEKLNAR